MIFRILWLIAAAVADWREMRDNVGSVGLERNGCLVERRVIWWTHFMQGRLWKAFWGLLVSLVRSWVELLLATALFGTKILSPRRHNHGPFRFEMAIGGVPAPGTWWSPTNISHNIRKPHLLSNQTNQEFPLGIFHFCNKTAKKALSILSSHTTVPPHRQLLQYLSIYTIHNPIIIILKALLTFQSCWTLLDFLWHFCL